jgi:hypothetical protein
MFAVDDLTAGLTLKSQSELLRNSVPVRTDPPCRDNAAIADSTLPPPSVQWPSSWWYCRLKLGVTS